MAFFGLAWKRSRRPQARSAARLPSDVQEVDEIEDSSFVVSRPGGEQGGDLPAAGVEVCELSLDAQDFESTFGANSSQFEEGERERAARRSDPWVRLRRCD
jgi:hypothetical protein